jgi:hypothetical protein
MNHKKLAVLALLVAAVSQSSFGQGKPSAAVSDELVAAETQMFAKITQQDPAYMKDLVAEDYFSIKQMGRPWTRLSYWQRKVVLNRR